MKKNLLLSGLLILAVSLAGCSSGETPQETSEQTTVETSALPESSEEETQQPEETLTSEPETSAAETTQTEPETTQPETEAEWVWQKDAPENHGLDTATLESFHDELDPTQVLASVIVKDGVIVDEYYKDGYDENSVFLLHSCSKSVTSALIGIAIDKGYIEGTDVLISEYFPQILESDNENLKEITLWHVLTHTTGLDIGDTTVWDEWRASDNWVDYVLNRPSVAEPGTVFDYSTGGTHLLSAILQEATGMTAYEFGKQYLFEPLGMDSVTCDTDPQGISDGGNGFHMNVYDMAKFGLLYLNSGQWQGEQIISQEWVEASTSLQFKRDTGTADYGYQWWVRTFGDEDYPSYFAQGHAGQYIFVVPDLELIIVFTSNHTGSSSMYWDFVENIVNACQS